MRRLAAPALALVLAACASAPTQLVVVVDTNLDVPAEIDTVELSVTGPDGIRTVTPQPLTGADAPSFPLTLGVAPSGDALGPIAVAAIGRRAGEEIVRTGATGITLLPGESRVLHLVLVRGCVGRECGSGEACGVDACAATATEAADLEPWTGTPPTFDDSDPCLAMPWDADDDGDGSVECGGTDCDDDATPVHVGATEACNTVDDDCDGMTDEDCDCTPLDSVESCTTSCGTTGTRTCTATGWADCVAPGEVCDGVDQDCDGLIDEGFDYVPSPVANVSANAATGNRSNEPDIAWSGDRFGVVWDDSEIGAGTHFATFDATGTRLTDPVLVSPGRTPAIAFGGGVFAVVSWAVEGTGLNRVYVRLVNPDGTFVADQQRFVASASADPRPEVLWDGSAFVLSCLDQGVVTFQRLAPDATPASPRLTVPARRGDRPDVAFDGTLLTFAWAAAGTLYASQGSELVAFPADAATIARAAAENPGLAWMGGNEYLLAWRGAATPTLEIASVDMTGPTAAPTVVLSDTRALRSSGTPNAIFVDVAGAGAQALVTWADARDGDAAPYAARIGPDGTILQMPTRLVPDGTSSRGEPIRASWDGGGWGIVWEEAETGSAFSEISYTRLACP